MTRVRLSGLSNTNKKTDQTQKMNDGDDDANG